MISQTEVKSFKNLQEEIRELENKLKTKKSEENKLEEKFLPLLESGEKIEFGPLTLNIKTSERRSIAYKELLIAAIGEDGVKEIQQSTEPIIYKHISVIENFSHKEKLAEAIISSFMELKEIIIKASQTNKKKQAKRKILKIRGEII